ncbi:SDR family NAD(P)-dependent oxidoreductase [Nakamurella alba]|uniref:SDR family NAD(P)-dependent oxidoreductase n=1 Tax=Nakamurella alba TaxID=2665158 RepID=UPI0018A9CA83|nr:SDR family oxidoreductase [Nakamurella alba]
MTASYPPVSPMSVDLRGKVAVVTGAASGIGLAVAMNLAAAGAQVLATDRDPTGLDALAAATGEFDVRTFPADLLDPSAPQAIVAAALEAFGGLHILACCAGIFETAAVEDVTPESFDRVIGVNLKAPVFLVGAAKPHLAPGSAVVLIASGTSLGPTGYQGVYAASKAGIATLAASLAAELAPQGIRVNALSPGFTDTPMIAASMADKVLAATVTEATPDRSIGTPQDVAGALLFLVSDGARHIHGINLPVDGGFSQVSVTPALFAD